MNTVSAFGIALLLAAPVPKDGKKPEASLVGRWEWVELVGGGRAADEAETKGVSLEFSADGTMTVRFGGRPTTLAYTVRPDKKPPEIDLTEGKKGLTKGAIYRLDGDALTFCMPAGNDQGRPEKFESPEGSAVLLMKLKRVVEKM